MSRVKPRAVWVISAATLVFHLLTASRYGIFCDELYYIACSRHLAWGYVDQPPLIAGITWLALHLFGDSLLGLRLIPAIAGAAVVWLTARLAREMGGGGFAQTLAALASACVPVYFIFFHWMTMNAFDPLLWTACACFVARAINSGDARYWLWFGVFVGIGMENKYTIAFFICGVVLGLLATRERKFLATRWFWVGAAAALAIFLPNLIWLARHNFPFLELMRNVRASGRDVSRAPLAFVGDQALIMNPVAAPLWMAGVVFLFFSRYRVLGWAFAFVFLAMMILGGKDYYTAAVYPLAFAAGGIAFESLTRIRFVWSRLAYCAVLLVETAMLAPMFAPILSPGTFERYQSVIGFAPPKIEHHKFGALPQWFADEFGWQDMAREVARVYFTLAPDERAGTAIFANSYAEAGAIDFYGPKYGLPPAISPHQNYWYWGPRNYSGEVVIVTGSDGRGDREVFRSVEVAGQVGHPYALGERHFPVLVCRGLKVDLGEIWPKLKRWR